MDLLMPSVIAAPTITIEYSPKTGDREDFQVRLTDAQIDYQFRLSLSGTILAIWSIEPVEAAKYLVDRIVYFHGTADAFDEEGFWFDSNNSATSLEETLHVIENLGSGVFDHPKIKSGLGGQLFRVLDKLDAARMATEGVPFVRSLDVLSERSQAGDDFGSEAWDYAHFIYRVCLASAILDRFNFVSPTGSLNGLKSWLTGRLSEDAVDTLTEPFFMIKKLRKQYPIHEEFEVSTDGMRTRRSQLEQAENYFGLRGDPASDWHAVRTRFVAALEGLHDV